MDGWMKRGFESLATAMWVMERDSLKIPGLEIQNVMPESYRAALSGSLEGDIISLWDLMHGLLESCAGG